MSHVVVISGHPNLEQSHTNTVILDQLQQELESVEIRRLDRLYPDYQIDIEAEQQALIAADVIVLQFPFYWYSVPALMKKWLDDVFAYNFAYGAKGDKLKGKDLFLSFTVGGPEESYRPLGYNHFTIEQLVHPLEQTAYMAGLTWLPPVYTNRMVYIPGVYNTLEDVQARARDHAERLLARINEVTASEDARIRRFIADWFTQFDQLPESGTFFTAHLAEDVDWVMPEGEFRGHQGFEEWYTLARRTFKPGCDHQVEQVEITPQGEGYKAKLRIRLLAETFAESDFKGESINMLVNETWLLQFNLSGEVQINDYRVTPVVSE